MVWKIHRILLVSVELFQVDNFIGILVVETRASAIVHLTNRPIVSLLWPIH